MTGPALTRETVDAAIGAGSSVAELARQFGVPDTSAVLRHILWELAQDRRISFHEHSGQVGRYTSNGE